MAFKNVLERLTALHSSDGSLAGITVDGRRLDKIGSPKGALALKALLAEDMDRSGEALSALRQDPLAA
ncbi:hypothetical protein [Pseudoxanthomonas sp. z9]|uniref:hypothetical protein n=1 Tax=Pseudoxanthomonas sp. z9 TaxID=2584942 RepID=UPI001142655B|nr:hypothetical protein [Pseudoxanthomonas sp. z9]